MHPQLALLLELQDLRTQYRELETEPRAEEVEEEHFNIDISQAKEDLAEKIADLEEALEPPVRRRYRRVAKSMNRVVAPVINGVCYGCFVSIPTAAARDQDPNEELQSCENCGRFIYILR
ncbi:MAG: hypothetical protein GWM92_16235 [Gemmatimonadetes bacterium]|nr:hypothetical protein [Gemmatimonadota bacterium]NIR80305.1 hypothetical protein [Gemmatimonadota bacterium]NIT89068.1 hypothetical protein [Gemmatimonadota bacterium]NIU32865.1 hypothetical protein [Gemmatimonadota bacterium]NIU37274.1 hypothetical protein [Gemmatimonadota bacterium]